MENNSFDISLLYKLEELVDNIIDEKAKLNNILEKTIYINPSYVVTYAKFLNEYLLYDYTNNKLLELSSECLEYIKKASCDECVINAVFIIYKEAFYYFSTTIFKKRIIIDSVKICKLKDKEPAKDGILRFLKFYALLLKFVTNKELEQLILIDKKLFCADLNYTKQLGLLIRKLEVY
jgi:hypothetical protein